MSLPYGSRPWRRMLCAAGLLLSIAAPAGAGLVTTDEVLQEANASLERQELREALQQNEVRAQLQAMGVSPDVADKRVARLTEQEVDRLHQRVDTLPAGGHASGLTIVLIVLLIVLLV